MIADNEAIHVTKSTFKEVLARDGVLVYRTRGVSMEPMLRQGRDLVTIRAAKPGERFHENDVVLYYQAVGRYVLHRIVGVGPAGYVILGDNCVAYERDVPFEDVLGILVSFVRDGKMCSVDDPDYLAYVSKLRRGERCRIARRRVAMQAKRMLKCAFPGLSKRWNQRKRGRGRS